MLHNAGHVFPPSLSAAPYKDANRCRGSACRVSQTGVVGVYYGRDKIKLRLCASVCV